VKVADEEALNKAGLCLFALEPHDVLPVSIFWGSDFIGALPGKKNLGCMTGVLFSIPIIRHIYSWVSAADASRQNCMRLLNAGYSLTIK